MYLDERAKSLVVFGLELVLDLYHVHLTACDHHPHQRPVISAQTLKVEIHLSYYM